MLRNGTDTCSCPNKSCERNGKCAECAAHHGERGTYCDRQKKHEDEPPVKDAQ